MQSYQTVISFFLSLFLFFHSIRLQGVPGGLRAVPALHQVLRHIRQSCKYSTVHKPESSQTCVRVDSIEVSFATTSVMAKYVCCDADGETPFSEDERGELLWALHGGTSHPPWQATLRDGDSGVCPPTQKVTRKNISFQGSNTPIAFACREWTLCKPILHVETRENVVSQTSLNDRWMNRRSFNVVCATLEFCGSNFSRWCRSLESSHFSYRPCY